MILGLAGGVGCGKTTVMECLEKKYSAKIIVTDKLGHLAMKKNAPVYCAIYNKYGNRILDENKEIDRKKLADIVYQSPEELAQLNQMIHPVVFSYIEEKLREWKDTPLIVIESAILFESGCDKYCEEVWGVITSPEIRIKRLQESRGYTKEKCLSIMEKQLSNEDLEKKCNKIIKNDGTIEELENQLQELLGI